MRKRLSVVNCPSSAGLWRIQETSSVKRTSPRFSLRNDEPQPHELPQQTPNAPVKEPPDAPQEEPHAPVREPDSGGPKKWGASKQKAQ